MVVQRTLTPPVGVRSSHPQPLRSRSTLLRFFITGCSAVGSALGSGPRGRGFESRHSDQKAVCTVSRYKRLFCLGVPRIRTARPRRSGAQTSPVGCLRGRGRIPSPDRRNLVPYPGTNGFFVLECRRFEQPDPAAAGRKPARWACLRGRGRIPSPDQRSLVPYPGANGFFVLECRGFEQPVPAAAGRKPARWFV